jgi:hypothetical protein
LELFLFGRGGCCGEDALLVGVKGQEIPVLYAAHYVDLFEVVVGTSGEEFFAKEGMGLKGDIMKRYILYIIPNLQKHSY